MQLLNDFLGIADHKASVRLENAAFRAHLICRHARGLALWGLLARQVGA
jgi:hypothetical protein